MKINLSVIFLLDVSLNLQAKDSLDIKNPTELALTIGDLIGIDSTTLKTYSCSGDGKVKVNGVKTRFSSLTECINGIAITYTCTSTGMVVKRAATEFCGSI